MIVKGIFKIATIIVFNLLKFTPIGDNISEWIPRLMVIKTEYDQDFYAWLMQNAQLLREHKFAEIDSENVAEELESMGKREKRELVNRLAVLLAHLLKWTSQSVKRSNSWKNTILTQRIDIIELLTESPSLKYELEKKIELAYAKAKLQAEDETGIDKEYFPEICPFTLAQVLDKGFFPMDTRKLL